MQNWRWMPVLFMSLSVAGGIILQAKQNWETPSIASRFAMPGNQSANQNCREWKTSACTVCSLDSATNISLKNKTKTPLLLCRDMKPGPARLEITTYAEPSTPGLWEVEFGLGYQTSARNECPHQFIASNNPPLKTAYDVGFIALESEIPADGVIQAIACVGLSSVRVGEEGKETGASLKISKLRIVSE